MGGYDQNYSNDNEHIYDDESRLTQFKSAKAIKSTMSSHASAAIRSRTPQVHSSAAALRPNRQHSKSAIVHEQRSSAQFKAAVECTLSDYHDCTVPVHALGSLYCDEEGEAHNCPHCDAFFWKEEMTSRKVYTTCCEGGKVKFEFLAPPSPLMQHLFTSTALQAKEFRLHIRAVNTSLAFASTIYDHKDGLNIKASPGRGPPVFVVQGNVKHDIDAIFPADEANVSHKGGPSFMQVYFVDTDLTNRQGVADNQFRHFADFSDGLKDVVRNIRKEIMAFNPYYIEMKQIIDLKGSDEIDNNEFCLTIANNNRSPHFGGVTRSKLYSAPRYSEVAAMVSVASLKETKAIVIYPKAAHGSRQTIPYDHQSVLPLSYPLFHMHGEPGWHGYMTSDASSDVCSAMAQHCFDDSANSSSGEKSDCEEAADFTEDAGAVQCAKSNTSTRKRRTSKPQNSKSCSKVSKDEPVTVTPKMFSKYVLQIRDRKGAPIVKDTIMFGGRLFQEYVIELFLTSLTHDLHYISTKQDQLKASQYDKLKAAVAAKEGRQEGHYVVLPSTFMGSPRWYAGQFHDAMARVRKFGKPDVFGTFTCNPNWSEFPESLQRELRSGVSMDRPDLVARVFDMKLQELLDDITKKGIFGRRVAHIHTVEWQKRGLPHVHFLLFLHPEDKPLTPADYDKFMCAELPDPETQPRLFELVKTHMIHGPCGEWNPSCPCMNEEGHCTKHYPKDFCDFTTHKEDDYPQPRRRAPANGGHSFEITHSNGRTFTIDNRWVVPYNPYLLEKYEAHINIEICNSIKAIKYLNKYIYKGMAKAMLAAYRAGKDLPGHENDARCIDEVKMFLESIYVGPAEAAAKLLGLNVHGSYPPVKRMSLHLEDNQPIEYLEGNEEDAVETSDRKGTMLLAYFEAVARENALFESGQITDAQLTTKSGFKLPRASQLTYQDFPEYFTFHSDTSRMKWTRRVSPGRKQKGDPEHYSKSDDIGRLYYVHPSHNDAYYLRMLLTRVKGATSHAALRTYEGKCSNTFMDTCIAMGLLTDDSEWIQCIQDAIDNQPSAYAIRNLFVIILINNEPSNPLALWDKFKNELSKDIARERLKHMYPQRDLCDINPEPADISECLYRIEDLIVKHSAGAKTLKDCNLPQPEFARDAIHVIPFESTDILHCTVFKPEEQLAIFEANYLKMNQEQKAVTDHIIGILEHIASAASQQLDGVHSSSVPPTANRCVQPLHPSLLMPPGKSNCIFIDAAGGTGKTFVLNTVLAKARSLGLPAVATAFSGIASIILEGGRTCHSAFHLPVSVPLGELSSAITNREKLGKYLKSVRLFIIDEAPMVNKYQLEAIERLMQQLHKLYFPTDIENNDDSLQPKYPFAGVLFVLGGDFRQTTPVLKKATPADIVQVLIKNSHLWEHFQVREQPTLLNVF